MFLLSFSTLLNKELFTKVGYDRQTLKKEEELNDPTNLHFFSRSILKVFFCVSLLMCSVYITKKNRTSSF